MTISFKKLTEGLKPVFVQKAEAASAAAKTAPKLYYNYGRSAAYYFYIDFPASHLTNVVKGYHGSIGYEVPNAEKIIADNPALTNVKRYTVPLSAIKRLGTDLARAKGDYDYQQDLIDDISTTFGLKTSFKRSIKESVNPASAKVDDTGILAPESNDKKIMKKVFGDTQVHDADDTLDADLKIKGEKSKSDINKNETVVKEGYSDVNIIHKEEAFDLYDEVADLMENLDFMAHDHSVWPTLTSRLRDIRDTIIAVESDIPTSNPEGPQEASEGLEEGYKAGTLKLKDGSKVKLSKDDANHLNKMFDSTSAKKEMNEDVTKDATSFKEILAFARSINESFELDEVSKQMIDKYLKDDGKPINEVSNKTLLSYVKKSAYEIGGKAAAYANTGDENKLRKSLNRSEGVTRAAKTLAARADANTGEKKTK